MIAVRSQIRIAMDDAMAVFDNVLRSGCLAPEQVNEASCVVDVSLVQ